MKSIKKSLIKKVCIYVLCTCIVSTSVFMSYSNTLTVRAIDEEAYYKTAVGVCLTLAGVIEIAATGGSLTPVGVAQIVVGLGMAGIELKDYLIDNGDGTYTMSQEFIQLVVDEAIKLENSGFNSKDIANQRSGNLYNYSYNVSSYTVNSTAGEIINRIQSSSDSRFPVAGYLIINNDGSSRIYFHTTNSSGDILFWIGNGKWINIINGKETVSTVLQYTYGGPNLSYSCNFPIFGSREACEAYLKTGTGYEQAENYREEPLFEYGSVYAPVYNGGSVTFRKEVLDGFEDKLQEVNDKYDDVDDKVNALYEYILNNDNTGSGSGDNDDPGSGSGSGGSGDYDGYFDSILDYLKKIYSRLGEVLEEIKDFDFSDWLKDISSSLKEISGQIKDLDDAAESMDRLSESFRELLERMDDDTYGQEIRDLLQQLLDEMRNQEGQDFEGVIDSMDSIDEKLQQLIDLVGDDMSRDDIEDILQQILEALNDDGVIDGIEGIEDKLQELIDSINDNMSRDDMEDILQQILDELKSREEWDPDGVIDGMEGIEDKLQELIDSINDNMSRDDMEDLLQQILDEMKEREGPDLDGITDRLDSLDETLNEILKELKNSGDDDGLFGDLISLLAKILDDPEAGSQDMVDALSSSLGELASGLTEKFPFSIPWDIQYILLGLAETPKAPRFELPIRIERYGIDEKVVIDMEMFETLSDLSRSFFSVLFAIFLINLTFKVVGMKKED